MWTYEQLAATCVCVGVSAMKLDPELAIAKTKTDFQQSNLTQLGTKFRNQKIKRDKTRAEVQATAR